MGLNLLQLKKVLPYIKGNVLSLGYPDLLVNDDQLKSLTGISATEHTDNGKWHQVDFKLAETRHVFSKLGATLTCVDITQSRGIEKVIDLNHQQELGSFDLVIDPGTIEHCFNVAQALMNAANAVKEGGMIYHGSPLTMINHGFYNFCPTLFYDFYTQNGFNVEISINIQNKMEKELTLKNYIDRFGAIHECSLLVLAKRNKIQELKFPTQTKYITYPELNIA